MKNNEEKLSELLEFVETFNNEIDDLTDCEDVDIDANLIGDVISIDNMRNIISEYESHRDAAEYLLEDYLEKLEEEWSEFIESQKFESFEELHSTFVDTVNSVIESYNETINEYEDILSEMRNSGEYLIREDFFEEYAEQTIMDCYPELSKILNNNSFPFNHLTLDRESMVDDMLSDYTTYEIFNNTYYLRA